MYVFYRDSYLSWIICTANHLNPTEQCLINTMAGGAACLSNSNTRIIVSQIVTYIIIVRQIVTCKFTIFEIF